MSGYQPASLSPHEPRPYPEQSRNRGKRETELAELVEGAWGE